MRGLVLVPGEESETLVRGAYCGNYERLVILKRQYDPGNMFRLNLNIPPGDVDQASA